MKYLFLILIIACHEPSPKRLRTGKVNVRVADTISWHRYIVTQTPTSGVRISGSVVEYKKAGGKWVAVTSEELYKALEKYYNNSGVMGANSKQKGEWVAFGSAEMASESGLKWDEKSLSGYGRPDTAKMQVKNKSSKWVPFDDYKWGCKFEIKDGKLISWDTIICPQYDSCCIYHNLIY